jgi:hypothetical protein
MLLRRFIFVQKVHNLRVCVRLGWRPHPEQFQFVRAFSGQNQKFNYFEKARKNLIFILERETALIELIFIFYYKHLSKFSEHTTLRSSVKNEHSKIRYVFVLTDQKLHFENTSLNIF